MRDIPFHRSIYHASADFAHRRMTHRSLGVGGYGFGGPRACPWGSICYARTLSACCFLILAHEAAIALHLCTDDGSEFAVDILSGHGILFILPLCALFYAGFLEGGLRRFFTSSLLSVNRLYYPRERIDTLWDSPLHNNRERTSGVSLKPLRPRP